MKGATYGSISLDAAKCYFNPRTREGCDSSYTASPAFTALYFNPRTREGCDADAVVFDGLDFQISIHAPVKGATA